MVDAFIVSQLRFPVKLFSLPFMDSKRKRREFTVTGWSRPRPGAPEPESWAATDEQGRALRVYAADDDTASVEQGAEIHDRASGLTFRVTVDRSRPTPVLTSFQVEPPEGEAVNARLLAGVPFDRLATAAAQYLTEREARGGGVLVILPAGVEGRGFVPDLAVLGDEMTKQGRTRAEIVAEYTARYGVSRTTVDRWIAQAREEGHLPPSGRRKRRTTKTTDGGPTPSAER